MEKVKFAIILIINFCIYIYLLVNNCSFIISFCLIILAGAAATIQYNGESFNDRMDRSFKNYAKRSISEKLFKTHKVLLLLALVFLFDEMMSKIPSNERSILIRDPLFLTSILAANILLATSSFIKVIPKTRNTEPVYAADANHEGKASDRP